MFKHEGVLVSCTGLFMEYSNYFSLYYLQNIHIYNF